MLILDTDVHSILESQSPQSVLLLRRLLDTGEVVHVTVVTMIERLRGRIAMCSKARTPEEFVQASQQFHRTLEHCHRHHVLAFDDKAVDAFNKLKHHRLRIGTFDLRIAAIALAQRATLVTRNLSDFRQVPGLKVVNLLPS